MTESTSLVEVDTHPLKIVWNPQPALGRRLSLIIFLEKIGVQQWDLYRICDNDDINNTFVSFWTKETFVLLDEASNNFLFLCKS